jgi:hypothetical protein
MKKPTSTPRVLSITEWMIFGSRLGKPHITTIATEMSRFQSCGNVFLDHDSPTSCIDQPSTCKIKLALKLVK